MSFIETMFDLSLATHLIYRRVNIDLSGLPRGRAKFLVEVL